MALKTNLSRVLVQVKALDPNRLRERLQFHRHHDPNGGVNRREEVVDANERSLYISH